MAVDAGLVVPPRRLRVAVIVSGTALCLITWLLVAHWSTSRYDWLEALARAVSVGVPIAVGLYARRHTVFIRFGTLLMGLGLACFVATLANSPDEAVHSLGRIAGWCVEVAIVYIVLAFPTGRLSDRVDRVLAGAAALVVLALYLPTVLLVEAYPAPAAWDLCTTGCPGNAFDVLARQPGFVSDVVYPLREGLTVLIFVGVTVRLAARLGTASNVMRRTLEPVLVVAIFRTVAIATALVARRVNADTEFVRIVVWTLALAVPAVAVAFLLGLVRWRLFVANGMQSLATRLPGHAEPAQLEAALADAFDDPTIEIVYWLDGSDQHWVDARGHPVPSPPERSGRALTEVRDGAAPIAAIIHDAGLRDDDAFIATATAYALMTLDNQRLAAQTRGLLREVSASRRRIQATADDERRRIERDLHDGAQQRLVALRIKLELEAEQTEGGDPERAATLRRLGGDVEDAIDEMRSLARGIYPAALADRGLVDALRGAALQSPLPTTLLAAGVGRYSREIETTAYFCCLEALQNAAKHALGAGAAVIDVSDTGSMLRMEVRDDGAGFDAAHVVEGTGFVNMRDRVAAVAGELVTISSPGRGTRIVASIPLPDRPERAP